MLVATQTALPFFEKPFKYKGSGLAAPWALLLDAVNPDGTSRQLEFSKIESEFEQGGERLRRSQTAVAAMTEQMRARRQATTSTLTATLTGALTGTLTGGSLGASASLGAKVTASQYDLGNGTANGGAGRHRRKWAQCDACAAAHV